MELTVQPRTKFGKATRALRREGLIPAELYGRGIDNLHLTVQEKDFNKLWREAGESTLINIVFDSKTGERLPVMIHHVSLNPVSDRIESIDFYQVRLDEKIKVRVPIEFIGSSPAIKEKGAVLIKAMQEIELEALPGKIPRSIQADISLLKDFNQSIHVKDLNWPPGVSPLINPETAIATVKEKAKEEEAAVKEEPSIESIKVEGEEKRAEREAKKTAEAPDKIATKETKPAKETPK